MPLERFRLDRMRVVDLNDACWPHRGIERRAIHRFPIREKMQRRVHVCAGVRTQGKMGDVADGAFRDLSQFGDGDFGVSWPVNHPAGDADRNGGPAAAHLPYQRVMTFLIPVAFPSSKSRYASSGKRPVITD